MATISRRRFGKGAAALVASSFVPGTATPSYARAIPAFPGVATTLDRTVIPESKPSVTIQVDEVAKYAQYGYGAWHYGAGLDYVRRLDLMPPSYTSAFCKMAAPLLRFFTITDIHICDKESPSSAIYLGIEDGVWGGYSPVMLASTQVLDAAVRTINTIHERQPVDFGISLGDVCNNTQYNELRWYIGVLDGQVIPPSSGVHAGAATIDYQKPYQAAGLDRAIKWYKPSATTITSGWGRTRSTITCGRFIPARRSSRSAISSPTPPTASTNAPTTWARLTARRLTAPS